jgi:hypothetical protein
MVIVYLPGCVPEVPFARLVFMVKAELTEPLPGVRPEGEKEQFDCAGRPEQGSPIRKWYARRGTRKVRAERRDT